MFKGNKIPKNYSCNDDVANDELRKTLLTQVTPLGIQSHIVGIDNAIRVINNPKHENNIVLLLFTNPTDVLRLVDAGINIKSVN